MWRCLRSQSLMNACLASTTLSTFQGTGLLRAPRFAAPVSSSGWPRASRSPRRCRWTSIHQDVLRPDHPGRRCDVAVSVLLPSDPSPMPSEPFQSRPRVNDVAGPKCYRGSRPLPSSSLRGASRSHEGPSSSRRGPSPSLRGPSSSDDGASSSLGDRPRSHDGASSRLEDATRSLRGWSSSHGGATPSQEDRSSRRARAEPLARGAVPSHHPGRPRP
jgi:hypothetical protein